MGYLSSFLSASFRKEANKANELKLARENVSDNRTKSHQRLKAVSKTEEIRVSRGLILPPPPVEVEEVEASVVAPIMPLVEKLKELPYAQHFLPTVMPGKRRRVPSEPSFDEVDAEPSEDTKSAL